MTIMATSSPRSKSVTSETLLFVDVDGVLNVGIRDGRNSPILLNMPTLGFVAMRKDTPHLDPGTRCTVERVLAVQNKKIGDGDNGTYSKFACTTNHVSDVFASRLAGIIQIAGEGCRVVLCSTWRNVPERVEKLESIISRHLGTRFAFFGSTRSGNEKGAADRMKCIGAFISRMFAEGHGGTLPMKVLVLEDLFITPFNGWWCSGLRMWSTRDAEAYLRSCAPEVAKVAVKIVHTYAEWRTPGGLQLQLGAGLLLVHCQEAEHFLGRDHFVEHGVCCMPFTAPRPLKLRIRSRIRKWHRRDKQRVCVQECTREPSVPLSHM